jgi:two-component system, NarL family, invasion response regulator UvrY
VRTSRDDPVTVLAVDDQEIFRVAARELIAAADDFEQVGEAASGADALTLAAQVRPDLILVDVRMPEMDGIETARRLTAELPESLVVLVSLEPASDLPSALTEGPPLIHVRKQDLSVRKLAELWRRHGPPARR